jgi:hypothetical protein
LLYAKAAGILYGYGRPFIDGEKDKRRAATRALLWAGGVAFFMALSCGEALGPLEPRWVHVADFPPDVLRVNGISPYWSTEEFKEEVGVYAVVERGGAYDALVKCSRYGFSIELEMNERYDGGSLADVASYGGGLWISGAKVSGKIKAPFILRKPYPGEWEEIPVPYRPGAAVSAVVPINEADCWFLVDDHYRPGTHHGTLYKYSRGEVTTYAALGDVTVARAKYPGRRGHAAPPRLYAVTCGGAPAKVFATEDEGASWAEETLPPDVVPGYHLLTATAAPAATAGLDLYLIVDLGYEGEAGRYGAVVKRTGPPGSGEYEPVFIATEGPYFADLSSLAFVHPGYRDYGLGVGYRTTVLFDEGNVYLERLPYPLDFAEVVVSETDGFFAVGNNSAFGGWELMYHP